MCDLQREITKITAKKRSAPVDDHDKTSASKKQKVTTSYESLMDRISQLERELGKMRHALHESERVGEYSNRIIKEQNAIILEGMRQLKNMAVTGNNLDDADPVVFVR